MGKNHSLSNLHVRTKHKPHVRWIKETDEWEAYSYKEEIIEPIEEKDMGKVKGLLEDPTRDYEPVCLPPERELLYAISNLVVALRHEDKPIADLPECIEAVDRWLTEQYSELDRFFKKNINGNGVVNAGNGHIEVCEEDN